MNPEHMSKITTTLSSIITTDLTTTTTRATITTNRVNEYTGKSQLIEFFIAQQRATVRDTRPSLPDTPLFYYTPTRRVNSPGLWCQSDVNDYCPLVISLMLIVIILCSVFIVCLCYSKNIVARLSKWTMRRSKANRNSMPDSETYSNSTNAIYVPTVASIVDTMSEFNLDTMRGSSQNSNRIWFTENSLMSSNIQPPSYEESQQMQTLASGEQIGPITKSNFNRSLRTYPRKVSNRRPIILSASVNRAFTSNELVGECGDSTQPCTSQQQAISTCSPPPYDAVVVEKLNTEYKIERCLI